MKCRTCGGLGQVHSGFGFPGGRSPHEAFDGVPQACPKCGGSGRYAYPKRQKWCMHLVVELRNPNDPAAPSEWVEANFVVRAVTMKGAFKASWRKLRRDGLPGVTVGMSDWIRSQELRLADVGDQRQRAHDAILAGRF